MPLRDNWMVVTTYTHLGFTLAASVLLGFFGGYWLDGKLGSKPILALIGAMSGAAGGFIYLIRSLIRMQKENEADDDGTKTSA